MASLGELTAGIAHEIQNPLNFVNNFSETNTELIEEMEQEILNRNFPEVKQIATNVKQNNVKINYHGKRADGIVKVMMQHARSSTGDKVPTDINTLIMNTYDLHIMAFEPRTRRLLVRPYGPTMMKVQERLI